MKDYLCTIVKAPAVSGSFDFEILIVALGLISSVGLTAVPTGEANGATVSIFCISIVKICFYNKKFNE